MNKVSKPLVEANTYWENACQFFNHIRHEFSTKSYFIHTKNKETVKIGFMPQVVFYLNHGVFNYTSDDDKTRIVLQAGESIFQCAKKLLKTEIPCFFMVSPDIYRGFTDENLPQMVFVQPSLEMTFSKTQIHGKISYAKDLRSEQHAKALLQEAKEKRNLSKPHYSGDRKFFSEVASSWQPLEEDENFLKRLNEAVVILRDFPQGKMVLTRSYEQVLDTEYDPFKLYELYARLNGDYACSHFFCVSPNVFSLGCSPENLFEIDDNHLKVDVVAATRGVSNDDDVNKHWATELYTDPKEVKEHKMALNRYMANLKRFCKEGSVSLNQEMQIKQLRHVRHLYSIVSGELLSSVTPFNLLEDSFPPLVSYPETLIPLADTETEPHRFYAGLLGYMHSNSADCFLNIRNLLLKNKIMYAKAGVGVVSESIPQRELLEVKNKLSSLIEATYLWQTTDNR